MIPTSSDLHMVIPTDFQIFGLFELVVNDFLRLHTVDVSLLNIVQLFEDFLHIPPFQVDVMSVYLCLCTMFSQRLVNTMGKPIGKWWFHGIS